MNLELQHQEFWRLHFPHQVELTALPYDKSVSPVPSYLRATVDLPLDPSLPDRLHGLSSHLNMPPLAVLLAAFKTVLFRYTGQETLVVGTAVRTKPAEDGTSATGSVLLPIQTNWSAPANLAGEALVRELGQQLVDAEAHSEYPLWKLQAWAGVHDSAFGTRLFNTALCLSNTFGTGDASWPMHAPELSEFLTQCDVVIIAKLSPSGLTLYGDYDSDLFEAATIQRLLGHMANLLQGIVQDPAISVLKLPLLTESERYDVIVGRNASDVHIPPSAPLHELFEAQVEKTPNAIALTSEGRSLTYRALNERANQLAHALRARGVGPDVLIGICMDRSLELVIGLLGILKAGGAYLPIDLAYPKERLAFMLEDAKVSILLTQSKLATDLPVQREQIVCLDNVESEDFDSESTSNPSSGVTIDNLAYVIYTSGTTGEPKGSLLTHHNVARLFPATQSWYGFNKDDVWVLFHSCAFDFSVWEIWGALLFGGRLVVVPFAVSRSPEAFYELLAKEQVTVLNQTPSAFRQLIEAEESVGQKELALRYIIFGGEALEMQSLRPWFERHGDQQPRLVNMYGITETTVHVTYRPLSKDDLESGSVIGVPIPDLQIYILDQHLEPVPVGIPGEMYVGGAGLARGYLHRPALTAERFIPDHLTGQPGMRLYRTGDLARFLPGRDIEYLGRVDHQVKIRGFRIELGEIETVLGNHPAVRETIVIAMENVPGNKRLVAYLVTSSPVPDVSALREHLKKKLPEYMMPAAFVFMKKLPLTASGKIDRKALPVPEGERPQLSARYVEPRTPLEKALAEIWSTVLRVEHVGVNDNFFEIGGDSILGIQTISLARREGLRLTPTLLFEHQTIAELAAVVSVVDEVLLSSEAVDGDVPLTSIQQWFFEQNLAEPYHYNQAFLFEVLQQLDRSLLECALRELSRHHDALRLCYAHEADGWRQAYSAPAEQVPLSCVSIAHLGDAARLQTVEEMAASAQASLRLQNGTLWRVIYFDSGLDEPGRLLFVVHHLAVDGISWRPLMEDLETVYNQLKEQSAIQLPAKTTSYKAWAERLQKFAKSKSLMDELPYWQMVTDVQGLAETVKLLPLARRSVTNTEGLASTLRVTLSVAETQALLRQVPAAYNTQINDVLLTALLRGWSQWSGNRVLFTNLEGHGRENVFEDTDLSRTVGWFTSVFPVRLELTVRDNSWQPGEALKSVKEQLRQIPHRGIGYGILRYLSAGSGLNNRAEPPMVFNYLGQFDQVLSGSTLFRFAKESTGAWHSPKQCRRHELEVNALVIDGRLEFWWTYNEQTHSKTSMKQLADEVLAALKELIIDCQSPNAGGRTPSDFPLTRFDQSTIDRLVGTRRDVEDIFPISPLQTLFLSADPRTLASAFDQWHCTLQGPLNLPAFRQAWRETVQRHAILRSTIHSEGLHQPVHLVHQNVCLPWTIEDWRTFPADQHEIRWSSALKQDRAKPLPLAECPVMRFALFRLADETWKFLWTVPSLLLDGSSWPLVFRDASQLYSISEGAVSELDPAHPYREYIEWLSTQSPNKALSFWREALAGFREPTPLLGDVPDGDLSGERYARHTLQLSDLLSDSLQDTARHLQATLNTLVTGAWALLLSRQSSRADVLFGAAFAGRPTDLTGADSIVGPFVNNLPVRLLVNQQLTAGEFFHRLHTELLQLSSFQFTPLMEIQRSSEVPWRYRLFDSLIVFQNYLVDESALRFGRQLAISNFVGPIHTNFPVMLLAEPLNTLRLTLIYDRQNIAQTTVERWARDLSTLLEQLPGSLEQSVAELQAWLTPPVASAHTKKKFHAQGQNFVPPQTEMERIIAREWQDMFALDQVSIEENFFELGGHSLLVVEMHNRLSALLRTEFPVVTLLEHPTVRLLARHLEKSAGETRENGERWRNRAQMQKQALERLRITLKK